MGLHTMVVIGTYLLSFLDNPQFIGGPGIWVLIGSFAAIDLAVAVLIWSFPSLGKWMLC